MSDLNRSPTSYTWQVPISDGNVLNLDARPGEAITVVGGEWCRQIRAGDLDRRTD